MPKTCAQRILLLLLLSIMGVYSQNATGNLQDFPLSYFQEDTSLHIPHSSDPEQHHVVRRVAPYENRLWPRGRIPYMISTSPVNGFSRQDKQLIEGAIAVINAKIPCLNLINRVGNEYYVHIVNIKGYGCTSHSGYQYNVNGNTQGQELFLEADKCLRSKANPAGFIGTALHELMHLAGFHHEHNRHDRDKHITIKADNIIEQARHSFDKQLSAPHLQLPYDFNSLLHTGAFAFSKNGLPTIEAKDGQTITGQRNGMTPLDELGLKLLYGCGDDSYPKVDGCKDDHDLCVYWASKGGCTEFTTYMEAACKKSCNKCQDLDHHDCVTTKIQRTYTNENDATKRAAIFQECFMSRFQKTYENENEKTRRAAIFQTNVNRMEEHNEHYRNGNSSFLMHVNEFYDMTYDEVISQLTGHHNTQNEPTVSRSGRADTDWYDPHVVSFEYLNSRSEDLRGSISAPIKHQGTGCGSCWAYSAVATIESHLYYINWENVQLSEQYLVDCGRGVAFAHYHDHGCDMRGGLANKAMEYVQENGIALADGYPNTADVDNTCKHNTPKTKYIIKGVQRIRLNNDKHLMAAILLEGAVSVSIFVGTDFHLHGAGIYDKSCKEGKAANHAVVLVGYGEEGGHPYWLIRNSWGATHGENGYIKLSRKENNYCFISSQAYIPIV